LHARWGILWRNLEVELSKVKSVVFACLILHNICIDFAPKRYAPPSAPDSATVAETRQAVTQAYAHVADVRAVYGVVLQSEAQRESPAWNKEKLERRSNTRSKMRDALAHAAEEANLLRPERSHYTAARSRAAAPGSTSAGAVGGAL